MTKEEKLQKIQDLLKEIYDEHMNDADDYIESIVALNNISIEQTFNDLTKILDKVFPIVGEGYNHKIVVENTKSCV